MSVARRTPIQNIQRPGQSRAVEFVLAGGNLPLDPCADRLAGDFGLLVEHDQDGIGNLVAPHVGGSLKGGVLALCKDGRGFLCIHGMRSFSISAEGIDRHRGALARRPVPTSYHRSAIDRKALSKALKGMCKRAGIEVER